MWLIVRNCILLMAAIQLIAIGWDHGNQWLIWTGCAATGLYVGLQEL